LSMRDDGLGRAGRRPPPRPPRGRSSLTVFPSYQPFAAVPLTRTSRRRWALWGRVAGSKRRLTRRKN
jgi:hypothetical protein